MTETITDAGTAQLVLAAVLGIAAVVLLIAWAKWHPFLALITGAGVLGLAAGGVVEGICYRADAAARIQDAAAQVDAAAAKELTKVGGIDPGVVAVGHAMFGDGRYIAALFKAVVVAKHTLSLDDVLTEIFRQHP